MLEMKDTSLKQWLGGFLMIQNQERSGHPNVYVLNGIQIGVFILIGGSLK